MKLKFPKENEIWTNNLGNKFKILKIDSNYIERIGLSEILWQRWPIEHLFDRFVDGGWKKI